LNTLHNISFTYIRFQQSDFVPFLRGQGEYGVIAIKQYDKVCQWLAAGRWFSPGTPVCSTNKSNRHDIAEIMLKVALNTITLTHVRWKNMNLFSTNTSPVRFCLDGQSVCWFKSFTKDKERHMIKKRLALYNTPFTAINLNECRPLSFIAV